jgi:glycosyltransferase involved in cell wall biosynthesis
MKVMKKKHPLLFIGPYPPPFSGPELGMKLFLESSLKDNFYIYFLKTNFRKTNKNKAKLDMAMAFAFFSFIVRLLYFIFRYRPKLAYYPITPTQIGWIGRDFWCLMICHLFRVKTVIHLRGSHFNLNFRTFHPLVKKMVILALQRVNLGLVQSESLLNQFDGLIKENKIKVLYNAIDTNEYINPEPAKYNPYNVLFMGHQTKAKGFCDLLRAMPKVAQKFPNVKFYCAGTLRKGERGVFFDQTTGKQLKYEDPFIIHNQISHGTYSKNYINLGIVTGEKKIKLLRESSIFLLPSYSEGFSRSLLEAMSMGKPVICTPVGAHKDVIKDGENGFLIKPGDIDNLAEKICFLLKDKELRERISQTNYIYVRNNFDISQIAKQMNLYLEAVINEGTA